MAYPSASTAKSIFKDKEKLLRRRGLPVRPLVDSSSSPLPSTACHDSSPPSLLHSSYSDLTSNAPTPKAVALERATVEHVPIPQMAYYQNLPSTDVSPGSRARIFVSPHAQHVLAAPSPPPSLSSGNKGQTCDNSTGEQQEDACLRRNRLLPLCTPYLSFYNVQKVDHVGDGHYHNVYYNTTYRIPDTLSYRRKPERISHSQPNSLARPPRAAWVEPQRPTGNPEAVASPYHSVPTAPPTDTSKVVAKAVCHAPGMGNEKGTLSSSESSAWDAEQRRQLSWHLIEPFFPDFGHRSLSDEELVRDLAERLQSLIEQQRQPTPTEEWHSASKVMLQTELPDVSRLFGLDDDLPPLSALQEAITTAYAEFAAMEQNFERINVESGEKVTEDPDTVELQRTPSLLSTTRFFVSKGCFMDTIPMLRCGASSVPERFIFSHGSYVRLTSAILLSRFNHIYRVREVLLEGTGNAFPLFPVSNLSECHAVRELESLVQWAVRYSVEQRRNEDTVPQGHTDAPAMPFSHEVAALEDYYVKLYDYNNFGCLPDPLWAGEVLGTVQDHVKRCVEDCLKNPHVDLRLSRLQQRKDEHTRKKLLSLRRRLFLGSIPSRETSECYRLTLIPQMTQSEIKLLEDTFSLAYGYFYAAQHYNITGGEGSMIHSVLCGKMPELALYDCLIGQEKLRLTLLNSGRKRSHSQSGPISTSTFRGNNPLVFGTQKGPAAADEGMNTSGVSPVLWGSPLLESQFKPMNRPTPPPVTQAPIMGSNVPPPSEDCATLFSGAITLHDFFPAKDIFEKELLCRALMQDMLALGVVSRVIEPNEEGDGKKVKNDFMFINEAARAMIAVILEYDANRQYVSMQQTSPEEGCPPPPPSLVFDDAVAALLRTAVPVDQLFRYQHCLFDYQGQMWRKSNLVEVVRAQYCAEVYDYCAEMQSAIVQADSVDYLQISAQMLAVEPYSSFPSRALRSKRRVRFLPIKFVNCTTGVASVRSVLNSLIRCDPQKPLEDVQEYLHHLLILYFRDYPFPLDHPRYPGKKETPLCAEDIVDAVTLLNWFDASPPQALCDQMFVDVYALASLCPLVLGRRLKHYAENATNTATECKAHSESLASSRKGCEGPKVSAISPTPTPDHPSRPVSHVAPTVRHPSVVSDKKSSPSHHRVSNATQATCEKKK